MKDIEGLSGINAAMTAALAERFLEDPEAVAQPWRGAFESMGRDALVALAGPEAVAVYEARRSVGQKNGHAAPKGVSAAHAAAGWEAADRLRIEWAVRDMIEAYRRDGHLHANTNPLRPPKPAPHIDLNAFGLSAVDFRRQVRCDVPVHEGATVAEVIGVLEGTWCGSIGAEVSHVEDRSARRWLIERLESSRSRAPLDKASRGWVLSRITEATLLEQFVHRKFVGAKRFSLEGGEALIPMLSTLINTAGDLGVGDIILGMAHRGRLNVMVNIFDKQIEDLFMRFHDGDALAQLGGGDVKYHHGLSHDVETPGGNNVHLSMCFNPSHLEFVNPVVLGRARAKQERAGDVEGKATMPLLIHGDSAIVGQGIVAESFNLMGLKGYSTGGTIHVVVNNQIGFTTEPHDSRTTRYCTDIAKWFEIPVLHVNGDDPEAAVFAAQVAAEFRQNFGKDVIIDLICYRRHGHNEGDEPRFTQPSMYATIDPHPPIRDLYAARLAAQKIVSEAEDKAMIAAWTAHSEEALRISMERTDQPGIDSMTGSWDGYVGGWDRDVPLADTTYPEEKLTELLKALCKPPEGFTVARKLKRFLHNREAMAEGNRPLDWGAGEALAFASLVHEGVPVRLSGQDGQRGTFSHRHAVMTDPVTGQRWAPVKGVGRKGAAFTVYNSPLSEASVMGFDWGYSLDRPESLTIWEAQFGDFANSAQVIIDQFLASSEDKWDRLSGLVLLLPHGYAGQGPEHSSARLERYLQMCAEDNMQVCNPTTPAQIFHLLRGQVLRLYRKPLIIMSPKSLLRRKEASSTLSELSEGSFQRVIPDQSGLDPKEVKRVILCSGRVYYDLAATRETQGHDNVAILRFEQLYPLSDELITASLAPYENAAFFWVQDEPWNHGPWQFIQARIRWTLGYDFPLKVVARAPSASPATGSKASHDFESKRLMEVAFGQLESDGTGSVCIHEV